MRITCEKPKDPSQLPVDPIEIGPAVSSLTCNSKQLALISLISTTVGVCLAKNRRIAGGAAGMAVSLLSMAVTKGCPGKTYYVAVLGTAFFVRLATGKLAPSYTLAALAGSAIVESMSST